jgi:UDP-N-acetylglucosamine acyltransferase
VNIHHTAIVDPHAEISEDVEIGAYVIIGPDVKVGKGVKIGNHSSVIGHTTIGNNNRIWPHVSLGGEPQDLSYKGEPTKLIIGDNNVIREFATLNCGTVKGGGQTVVGNNNMLMAYCHVPHDCLIGNYVIVANGAQLGGHVVVEDYANLAGLAAVHHFATIGKYSFIGGLTRIVHDAPPFMITEGNPSRVACVNAVGLRRKGFSEQQIVALRDAYKMIYRSTTPRPKAIETLSAKEGQTEDVHYLLNFLRKAQQGKRGRQREAMRRF